MIRFAHLLTAISIHWNRQGGRTKTGFDRGNTMNIIRKKLDPLGDQFFDLDFRLGTDQNVVPVDPVMNVLHEAFPVTDVFELDRNRLSVLFYEIEDIVPELNDHDLGSEDLGKFVFDDQQVIGVNIDETKAFSVFQVQDHGFGRGNDNTDRGKVAESAA
jgi:hypothetical protein